MSKKKLKSASEQIPAGPEEGGKREPPGAISLEEARALLGDSNLTDQEIEEAKEQVRLMVEIIYEKWLQDQEKKRQSDAM